MKTVSKTIKLSGLEYYKVHLLLINPLLPVKLTEKEAEVLAGFLSLEGDLRSDPFSTTGRKIVMERVGIKSAGGLGNYLNQLQRKGFLKASKGSFDIIPIVIPDSTSMNYNFKLTQND